MILCHVEYIEYAWCEGFGRSYMEVCVVCNVIMTRCIFAF